MTAEHPPPTGPPDGASETGPSPFQPVDPTTMDSRYLVIALCLIVSFMVFEVVMAVVSHSLALLADAGHMITDAGAIGGSLFALHLARRPAGGSWTYGFKRAEVLSALANGVTLLVVALLITYEGISHLVHPPGVDGSILIIVAGFGVVVNLAATFVMARADRRSLNIEGAFRHVVTDLYAFIGTAVAGVIIVVTGFVRADAVASLFVAAIMIKAAWGLITASGRVLLEAAPTGCDPDIIGQAIARENHVVSVHDVHVWLITSGFPALSAHILVDPSIDCHQARLDIERMLSRTFGITHTTLQADHVQPDRPLTIHASRPGRTQPVGASDGALDTEHGPPAQPPGPGNRDDGGPGHHAAGRAAVGEDARAHPRRPPSA